MALVAAGFSYRKPERLKEARNYLKNLSGSDIDPMPLIGCLKDLKLLELWL